MKKKQKKVATLHILYTLAMLMLTSSISDSDNCILKSYLSQIILLLFPIFLYWCGVWIWGFGYILSFIKKHKKFIKTTTICIFSISSIYILLGIHQELNYLSMEEIKNGCILPSFSKDKTCFNNKAYYNPIIKNIVNKQPYIITLGNNKVESKNKCLDKQFCLAPMYATDSILGNLYIKEIRSLENELKEKGMGEIFEMLQLFDIEWEDVDTKLWLTQ